MKITWKVKKDHWGGEDHICYAGEIPVGRACVNSLKLRNDLGKDYRYYINLPGLPYGTEGGTTEQLEEAKDHVTKTVTTWFEGALKE